MSVLSSRVVMLFSYQVKKSASHRGGKYIQIIQIFVRGGRKLKQKTIVRKNNLFLACSK